MSCIFFAAFFASLRSVIFNLITALLQPHSAWSQLKAAWVPRSGRLQHLPSAVPASLSSHYRVDNKWNLWSFNNPATVLTISGRRAYCLGTVDLDIAHHCIELLLYKIHRYIMEVHYPSCILRVSDVITHVPWTPSAAKVFRSAATPAPPPESTPAIVNAVGIT